MDSIKEFPYLPITYQLYFAKAKHPLLVVDRHHWTLVGLNPYGQERVFVNLDRVKDIEVKEFIDSKQQAAFMLWLGKAKFPAEKKWSLSQLCPTAWEANVQVEELPGMPDFLLLSMECHELPLDKSGDFQEAIQRSSIVSMADRRGDITYVNDNFVAISGYSRKELLGQNHRIINSGYHPRSFWVDMWKTIAQGKTWRAEVKNQAKNGSYYWVDTFVMPFLDAQGRVREFLSIRNDITQRKEQEEDIITLNRSLADFQRAIHSSSIVSLADRRGDITFVNDNFVTISGYSRKELLGQNHRIINSGFHPRSFWVDMWKTIAQGKTWRAEVKNQAKDGSFYWVDTFVMPFLDEYGKVREFLSIRNDITRRKQQEENIVGLNRSLAEFQNAIQSSSIISMADRRGDITYVNDNFIKISGYSEKELLGQNHRIVNSGHHPRHFWVDMWKTIAKGHTWRAEVKNQAKDGSYYWVDTFVMPFVDEHGKVREFLSIRNDITQRKEQEEDIITLNRSLAEFQKAIQSSSIVSMADRVGDITYVNDNFVAISGYSREELLGQNHRIINSGYHPRSFWVDMWKAISRGKTWRAEVKNQAKDGSYYWVDTFVMPFIDENGKMREFLSIRNDITSKKAVEEEELQISERLISTLKFARIGTAELHIDSGRLAIGPELYELLEEKGDKPVDMRLEDFLHTYVHPDDIGLITFQIGQGSNQPAMALSHRQVQFRVVTPKGKIKHIDALGVFRGTDYALGILQDVTEKYLMEEKIRQSETRLSSIFNGMISGVVVVDAESRINYANQSAANILMIEHEEMHRLYDTIVKWELMDEEEKPISKNEYPLQMALHGQEVVNKVVGIRFPTNQLKWLNVNAAPLIDSQGNINGAVSSFYDITDRKRAQRELFESKKYFESLVNSQSSYIIRTDLEGRYTFVNDKFKQQFGFLTNDPIGEPSLNSILPEDHELCRLTVEKCLVEPGKVVPVMLRKPREEGGFFWTEWEFVALVNEKNQVLGIQAVGLDVTSRIMAQQDLMKREAMIRNIASNIPVGAIFQLRTLHDGSYHYTYMSEGVEKVFGISASEVMANPPVLFQRWRPEDVNAYFTKMKNSLDTTQELEFSSGYKDEQYKNRYFTIYARAVIQPEGDVLWDGVILDKTEKMLAEQAMLKSYTQLRNASNLAHMGEWQVDLATQQVTWSDEVYAIHQMPLDWKPTLESAIQFYSPESRGQLEKAMQASMASGEPFDLDNLELIDGSGEAKWVRVVGVPEFEDSVPVRLFGLIQDVTHHKLTQVEIAQKNELMEEMSEMATMGAWEFTVETNKLLWTDQVYAIYGYKSANQMDLSTAINHYQGEAGATIQACFEACIQEGVAYDVILPFRDAAGRAKWIRTTGRPRKYKGKIISASGLFQDITKRHELELQMERTLARLSQYRNAVNSASIITIAYPNGEIRYVNKNFEQVSKYKGKELVGKPFFYLSQPFHPKEMWDQLVDTVNKGQIWRGELLSKGKDESLYWTDTFAIPYVDQENKVTEFLIISNDISKRKIYEKQIHQSLKEKEVIIQELHHRVKNNLQMIASMASMESYYTEKSTQSHNLKRLSHRIRIMSGIHERLLHTDTFYAIEAKEYLEQVLTDLEAGYKLFSREIGFTYTISPCFLSIDAATSLGLLFLEGFSILDDFFVDPTKGEVEISFAETSPKEYSLKFLSNLALDQGKVDIEQIRAGFSWEMLQTYIEQINAQAEFFMHDTFCFTLQFKDKLLPTDVS